MQQIKKEALKAMISCFFILISFFLGYLFAIKYHTVTQGEKASPYIEIVTKKSQIEIVSLSEEIDIILNGKSYTGGSIPLQ